MQKDLFKFLFEDSFKTTSDESISDIFEKLSDVENLEVKAGSLKKALKGLGYVGDVCVKTDDTAEICVDNAKDYSDIVSMIQSADGLLQLAELGWVPAFKDDDQQALDKPNFVVSFISISDPTPSDGDKLGDLEKLLKDADASQLDGKADGIGADIKIDKIPDGKKKDVTVPVAKNPKNAVRESGKSNQTLINDANFVFKEIQSNGLAANLQSEHDRAGARQMLLVWMNADEDDALPGFWNLFSNMEREDVEKVADKVLDKLDIKD